VWILAYGLIMSQQTCQAFVAVYYARIALGSVRLWSCSYPVALASQRACGFCRLARRLRATATTHVFRCNLRESVWSLLPHRVCRAMRLTQLLRAINQLVRAQIASLLFAPEGQVASRLNWFSLSQGLFLRWIFVLLCSNELRESYILLQNDWPD
jgi:hypothetical protein